MINYQTPSLSAKKSGNIKFPDFYMLYGKGRTKTIFSRDEARKLLKTGKWFDHTVYNKPNEAIQYEESKQRNGSSKAPSEWQKSQYQSYHADESHPSRTEFEAETIRTGASSSEVIMVKRRGRPKGKVNGAT